MTTVTTRFIENLDEIEAALDPLRVLELIGYSDKDPNNRVRRSGVRVQFIKGMA